MPPSGDHHVKGATVQRRRTSVGPSTKGRSTYVDTPQQSRKGEPAPPPPVAPAFSIEDVRAAVPKHCFKRSAVTSFMYLAWDLVRVYAMGVGATYIDGTAESVGWWAPYALWPLYWVCQGIVMTGLWVIGHECGHQAFSESKALNDLVGTIVHSSLLVPYHSWRITHGHHHKYTASIEDDEVFLPATRTELIKEMVEETPIASLVGVVNMLLFGWPLYLTMNIAGPKKYRGTYPNDHFTPWSHIFAKRDFWDVVASDIALFTAIGATYYAVQLTSFRTVAFMYLIPYLIVNYHLVMITYLQHTATYIPHYRRTNFSFLKGALSTVDRSFGAWYDSTIHHIASTHVAHHMFSTMPHYHAQEATEAIKELLGDYYLKDDTPIWKALWQSWRTCHFVEDEGDYVFYQKKGTPTPEALAK